MYLRALLLDLDGTLIDSDAAHLWAFNEILAPYGVEISPAVFAEIIVEGNNETIFNALAPQLDAAQRLALAASKEALVLSNLERIKPAVGARAIVRGAWDAGCRIAVVTNAPRANADAILAHVALRGYITEVVAHEDANAPKPSPVPYRMAVERLDVRREEAIAIEDSVNGVTSAVAAGLTVLGVAGRRPPAPLLQAGAAACFATLEEIGAAYGF